MRMDGLSTSSNDNCFGSLYTQLHGSNSNIRKPNILKICSRLWLIFWHLVEWDGITYYLTAESQWERSKFVVRSRYSVIALECILKKLAHPWKSCSATTSRTTIKSLYEKFVLNFTRVLCQVQFTTVQQLMTRPQPLPPTTARQMLV